VIKTPLKSFKKSPPSLSPPSSPPYTNSPPLSPSPSSLSSSSQTSHSSSSTMAFQPIVQSRYAALVLPPILDAFPNGYLKHLPRYNGETGPSAEDHLQAFLDFAGKN